MLNHIDIMGRLVAAPELRSTQNGVKVAGLRIACTRDRGMNGEDAGTDFIDVVAWRTTAEFICRNFEKGMPILISGRLQVRDWTDRDGKKRKTAEVIAENAYFCGGEHKQKAEKKPEEKSDPMEEIEDEDGELPWVDDGDELPL